jgi:hypothetical protein
MWIGYAVMVAGAIAVIGGIGIGAAMVSNKASHMVLDAYGGWKVFQEYRQWYYDVRPKLGAGGTATDGHNDRVEGRDAASSRRVPSHDGLCGNGSEVGAGDTAMKGKQ